MRRAVPTSNRVESRLRNFNRNGNEVGALGCAVTDSVTSLRSPVIDLTEVKRPKLSFQYYSDAVQDAEGASSVS